MRPININQEHLLRNGKVLIFVFTTMTKLQYSVGEVELTYKNRVPFDKRLNLASSISSYNQLLKIFDPNKIEYKESFVVIFCDKMGNMTGYHTHAQGGVDGCSVDIRQVLQGALLTNSAALIVAHNHPSGNLRPSRMDRELTSKLADACKILDIKLLDHIIVTSHGYYSFNDNCDL